VKNSGSIAQRKSVHVPRRPFSFWGRRAKILTHIVSQPMLFVQSKSQKFNSSTYISLASIVCCFHSAQSGITCRTPPRLRLLRQEVWRLAGEAGRSRAFLEHLVSFKNIAPANYTLPIPRMTVDKDQPNHT
jgi:hypothetical protein